MPKLPQALAERTSLGRPAVARDMGGGEGLAALGQAVGGIGDIAGRLFEEEMSADVSGSVAEANRALNDLSMQVQANPDHNARNKMYADGALKIAREAREGLRYPKFQGMFDERVEGSLERGRVGIAQGVRKAQVDSASANRMLFIESEMDALENIGDPTERVQKMNGIREEIQAGVRGGLWNAEQAAAMQIKIEDRVAAHELITESQVEADSLRDSIPDPQQRLEAARDNYTGPLRDLVVKLVEHQIAKDFELSERAERNGRKLLYHEVKAGVHADEAKTPVTVASVLEIAKDRGYGRAETENLLALLIPKPQAVKDALALRSREVFEEVRTKAYTPGPVQMEFFRSDLYAPRVGVDDAGQPVELPSYASEMGKEDLAKAIKLQQDGPASAHVLHGTRSKAVLDNLLNKMGLNYTDKQLQTSQYGDSSFDKRQERLDVIRTFWQFMEARMEESKMPWLLPDDMEKIGTDMLREKVLDTEWWDTTARVMDITPELLEEELGTMPADQEAAIRSMTLPEATARNLGRPVIGDGDDLVSLKLMRSLWKAQLLRESRGYTP